MNKEAIIDIKPVAHSRTKAESKPKKNSAYYKYPSPSSNSQHEQAKTQQPYGQTPVAEASYTTSPSGNAGTAHARRDSRVGGIVKIAAGGVCVLAGIPMLILPGPGLIAIGGGLALMASGAKSLLQK